MVLGDFNLQLHGVNARAQTSHSPTVRDYVEIKGIIMHQIPGLTYSFKDVIQQNRKLGKSYPQIKVWTSTHPFLTKLRERMYRPKKQLNKGILESLTPLGLALWYMDDGHLSIHHNVVRYSADSSRTTSERSVSSRPLIMNTHSFTKEENEVICSWLKSRWSIDSQVKHSKGFFIYMNTNNARKFVDIVRPYVLAVPSMHYKLNFKYKNTSPELLRFNIEYWTMEKGHECATSCNKQDDDIV